jgi:hypothetical protein
MRAVRSSPLSTPLRAGAALALILASGCVADEPALSSDPAAGVLAHLDYGDGASVELRATEDGVSVVATALDGPGPLAGIALGEVTAATLFETLTGADAPDSWPMVAKGGGPVATSAFACPVRARFCGTNLHEGVTAGSGGRTWMVDGHVVITSGSLRVRVIHNHVGDDRVLLERWHSAPYELSFREKVDGIHRRMRVVVDKTSDATYDMSVVFHSGDGS